MDQLIKALMIFKKYQKENTHFPTDVGDSVFLIQGIKLDDVSKEDLEKLSDLSFNWIIRYKQFGSYKYGGAY